MIDQKVRALYITLKNDDRIDIYFTSNRFDIKFGKCFLSYNFTPEVDFENLKESITKIFNKFKKLKAYD